MWGVSRDRMCKLKIIYILNYKNYIYMIIFYFILGNQYLSAEDLGSRFEIPIGTQRDANFNRIMNSKKTSQNRSIGATANIISISQSGSGNTIILNSDQKNSGTVTAVGSLNGKLQLD